MAGLYSRHAASLLSHSCWAERCKTLLGSLAARTRMSVFVVMDEEGNVLPRHAHVPEEPDVDST